MFSRKKSARRRAFAIGVVFFHSILAWGGGRGSESSIDLSSPGASFEQRDSRGFPALRTLEQQLRFLMWASLNLPQWGPKLNASPLEQLSRLEEFEKIQSQREGQHTRASHQGHDAVQFKPFQKLTIIPPLEGLSVKRKKMEPEVLILWRNTVLNSLLQEGQAIQPSHPVNWGQRIRRQIQAHLGARAIEDPSMLIRQVIESLKEVPGNHEELKRRGSSVQGAQGLVQGILGALEEGLLTPGSIPKEELQGKLSEVLRQFQHEHQIAELLVLLYGITRGGPDHPLSIEQARAFILLLSQEDLLQLSDRSGFLLPWVRAVLEASHSPLGAAQSSSGLVDLNRLSQEIASKLSQSMVELMKYSDWHEVRQRETLILQEVPWALFFLQQESWGQHLASEMEPCDSFLGTRSCAEAQWDFWDPKGRAFLVLNSQERIQGFVLASEVSGDSGRALKVEQLGGEKLSAGAVQSILMGLEKEKEALGVSQILLPPPAQRKNFPCVPEIQEFLELQSAQKDLRGHPMSHDQHDQEAYFESLHWDQAQIHHLLTRVESVWSDLREDGLPPLSRSFVLLFALDAHFTGDFLLLRRLLSLPGVEMDRDDWEGWIPWIENFNSPDFPSLTVAEYESFIREEILRLGLDQWGVTAQSPLFFSGRLRASDAFSEAHLYETARQVAQQMKNQGVNSFSEHRELLAQHRIALSQSEPIREVLKQSLSQLACPGFKPVDPSYRWVEWFLPDFPDTRHLLRRFFQVGDLQWVMPLFQAYVSAYPLGEWNAESELLFKRLSLGLNSPDWAVQAHAAHQLGYFRGEQLSILAQQALEHSHGEVREKAVLSLSSFMCDSRDLAPMLTQFLQPSQSLELRKNAVLILAHPELRKQRDLWMKALKDPSASVRKQVSSLLHLYEGDRLLTLLVAAFEDREQRVWEDLGELLYIQQVLGHEDRVEFLLHHPSAQVSRRSTDVLVRYLRRYGISLKKKEIRPGLRLRRL
ncbi:MAG: HEAT repeat domain-containing protein [Bdellovibrionia bacterium]